MPRALRAAALLATLLLGAACATVPPAGPPPAAVPIERPDWDAEIADFRLTVYPTPLQAEYGSFLLPLEGARRVDVGSDDFLDVLEDLELVETWRDLPGEGYVLHVGWFDGRTVVVLAGADQMGSRWAAHALAQLTTTGPTGAALVRDCLIVDAPAFRLRGNKRPQVWEEAYRANFAWGARDDDAWRRRAVVPFFAPGSPFDATADGVRAALETFGPWQTAGARRFAVKFDDVGFGLTPRSQLAFGTYPRALVVYLESVREALRAVDPDAVLYYLPQTYWWDDERLRPFAAAVRASGGLPADVGLVFTGPQIISETIDAAGLDVACSEFGATITRPLVYDNLGREGDWGPLTGRDPLLANVADGVFGERGTPVNRLTRLDWSWNPVSYDPERSWRRAMLELAGPRGYAALRDVCRAYREGRPGPEIAALVEAFEAVDLGGFEGPVPRAELVRLLRADLRRLADRPPAP